MMTFEQVKDKITKRDYLISQHAFIESAKDRIEDEDIRQVILSGKVIETYPDDVRGESILINGLTMDGKPLHVVLGVGKETPVIITVYMPLPPKWVTPETRGGRNE